MRSVCTYCESPIPWYNNIPVLSYFILRGKTGCCKQKLSAQYPTIEAITGLLFVFAYWYAPYLSWGGEGIQVYWSGLLRSYHLAIFMSLMLVCSVIDMRYMIIPDVISIPMILLTPVIVYYHPDLGWQSALFGVLVGGGLLYGVAWLYWIIRGEIGLGFGDVKLLAAIGGWLGVEAIIPTILVGSVLGTIVGIGALFFNRHMSLKSALPFGPFLAFGACFHMFYDLRVF